MSSSLFRNSSATIDTRREIPADHTDPTYYDVLKCHGEFATPSAFFSRQLKPAPAPTAANPWAAQPAAATDTKHRLRRAQTADIGSHDSSSSSSSAFAGPTDGALPASVFRLPTQRALGGEPSSSSWAMTGMTSGGRALRRANQVKMSVFDRKITLV
ncbi:hypothetical protein GGI24_004260 [Coemansia furcata]|nr:hypothetical protein GGI24_004260 [Coemansia furcata]